MEYRAADGKGLGSMDPIAAARAAAVRSVTMSGSGSGRRVVRSTAPVLRVAGVIGRDRSGERRPWLAGGAVLWTVVEYCTPAAPSVVACEAVGGGCSGRSTDDTV